MERVQFQTYNAFKPPYRSNQYRLQKTSKYLHIYFSLYVFWVILLPLETLREVAKRWTGSLCPRMIRGGVLFLVWSYHHCHFKQKYETRGGALFRLPYLDPVFVCYRLALSATNSDIKSFSYFCNKPCNVTGILSAKTGTSLTVYRIK